LKANSKSSLDSEEAVFAHRLLSWFDEHGRHNLPWQQDITPYRVWVSEIMLQQTQVSTVIPYYLRFMESFPYVQDLAAASEDDVLHHWTGLGYYARGRNLLRAAKTVVEKFAGQFPSDPADLETLPGIGRSTAAAIASISFNSRHAILDGNVKRVLCRVYAIDTSPYETTTLQRLWDIADRLMPESRCADYTQAIMDLGATVCTRTKARCHECPMQSVCAAFKSGTPAAYPAPRQRKKLPERRCRMLVIRNPQGEILLQKRPPQGIWGGLWSLPQFDDQTAAQTHCLDITGHSPSSESRGQIFRHTFSHYHLDIEPVYLSIGAAVPEVNDNDVQLWYRPGEHKIGLAAPVKKILEQPAATVLQLPLEQA